MNILITGGAGFIASNIVSRLLKDNHDVIVIDNLLSGHLENLGEHKCLNFINGDIRDEKLVEQLMKDIDVVFHLAASVGNKRSIDFPKEDAAINVMGTLNILEAMRKYKVPKIVASSSAGIYGELIHLPIHESHPIEPVTPYASTKLCMEKQCLSYAHIYEMSAVCLRYFNVYGVNQRFDAYGNVIPIFVYNLLNGYPITVFGDGNQTRDFVNVDDVVQANINAAFSTNISGAFNIASGTGLSINDLIIMLQDYLNIKGEVIYSDIRQGDVLHSDADISSARQSINYSPTVSIENGLKKYLDWAKIHLRES